MRPYIGYDEFQKNVAGISEQMLLIFQNEMDRMKEKYNPDIQNYNDNIVMYSAAVISHMIIHMFNSIGHLETCRNMYSRINETACNSLFNAQLDVFEDEQASKKDMH